ncbi:MAG: DUF3147 family protein [candidate division Zixibacteria bacterium]|nr:DUF3147 family protein [candidate division Zixibacteria bacterium]
MMYYIIKIVITTASIVAISEIAKRSSFFGALLASIPIVSVLAMIWLYVDTKDVTKVSSLATSVFWLVIPSLALFVSLPLLLKAGLNFYLSLSISSGITILCYWLMVTILNSAGIKL